MADQARFAPLADLTLGLPRMVAHTLRVFLQPGSTQPGRDGIDVPPMSGDWLQQCRRDSRKDGYPS